MTGFEVINKGETFQAALEKGVVTVILTKHKDLLELDFAGLNTENENYNENIDWHRSSLRIGDEIIIRVKDIFENSEPVNVRRQEKKSKDEVDLENYKRLKRRLEEKGLI
ncbi:hypothetical protein [Autumnicola musiva]|uniref:S1 motif domain-containing protein n=1 Tax=Autumnicola musiva TaxID=3075589 RepID=A0ABU3D7U8_9FLAO|nr:hypothetical protein [Zunongwangia sp. F117]MDT0677609.1 hypothetical protein [Zunongwangia sp. F117]